MLSVLAAMPADHAIAIALLGPYVTILLIAFGACEGGRFVRAALAGGR